MELAGWFATVLDASSFLEHFFIKRKTDDASRGPLEPVCLLAPNPNRPVFNEMSSVDALTVGDMASFFIGWTLMSHRCWATRKWSFRVPDAVAPPCAKGDLVAVCAHFLAIEAAVDVVLWYRSQPYSPHL